MLDYSFYTETYKGYVITSLSIFDRYKVRAERYFQRLESLWCISYDSLDPNQQEIDKNMAICSIMDNIYEYSEQDKDVIKSESNGSYSVSYESARRKSMDDAILSELGYYLIIYRGR